MSQSPRIVRLYSRMLVGGAERHVNQLLAGIPGTEMVVAGPEGIAAVTAQSLAARYTHVAKPRLAGIVQALRGADLVHIHTVNNEPILPLAVQLAGPRTIVQTIHNTFEAQYCRLVDHSFLIGVDTVDWIETPALSSPIGEGIAVGPLPSGFSPWVEEGRPLRLVEVRREDKPMAWTLEDILATGVLDGCEWEATIVGIEGRSEDPRIQRIGEVECPDEQIAAADFLVLGSAIETFGRTVYEAMALGTVPIATPIPAFVQRLKDGEQVHLAKDMSLKGGAACLGRVVQHFADRPEAYEQARIQNHRFVSGFASEQSMVAGYTQGYQALLSKPRVVPRSFSPDDVSEADLPALGALLDAALSGRPPSMDELKTLPDKARGIAFWLLADQKLVADDARVPLLRRSLGLLGPRAVVAASLGVAARHRNQTQLAMKAFSVTTRLNPYIVTPWLERADHFIRKGDVGAATAELEGLLKFTPSHALALRLLSQLRQPRRRAAAKTKGPFARFSRYKRIIVTGPHRSGTTIAMEMIAQDTGFEAVREEQFDHYREDMLRGLLQRDHVVVQCPALFDQMPDLSHEDTAIVLMRRPLEELEASRERMFAPGTGRQMSGAEQNQAQLARLGVSEGDSAGIKYEIWDDWVAKGRLHNPVEIQYAELVQHPMWVTPEDRRKLGQQWHNRRTSV